MSKYLNIFTDIYSGNLIGFSIGSEIRHRLCRINITSFDIKDIISCKYDYGFLFLKTKNNEEMIMYSWNFALSELFKTRIFMLGVLTARRGSIDAK